MGCNLVKDVVQAAALDDSIGAASPEPFLIKIQALEDECRRLRDLNDKLLDDVVRLELAYQDAIGPRQFIFEED